MQFLSTHLHCDLFEYFYDNTILCCVTVFSLMSSCATNLLLILVLSYVVLYYVVFAGMSL